MEGRARLIAASHGETFPWCSSWVQCNHTEEICAIAPKKGREAMNLIIFSLAFPISVLSVGEPQSAIRSTSGDSGHMKHLWRTGFS